MNNEILVGIIDDCKLYSAMISYILKKDKDVEILKYTSREEYFNDKDTILDLLVLDHTLNDLNGLTGLDVLKEIRETDISTPIIVLSKKDIKVVLSI
jgi:DNA-binding NarL/FixJ family response regulator